MAAVCAYFTVRRVEFVHRRSAILATIRGLEEVDDIIRTPSRSTATRAIHKTLKSKNPKKFSGAS